MFELLIVKFFAGIVPRYFVLIERPSIQGFSAYPASSPADAVDFDRNSLDKGWIVSASELDSIIKRGAFARVTGEFHGS
jgi:hypothetical protein